MNQNFNVANHLDDEDAVDFSSVIREHYLIIISIALGSFLLSLAVTLLMDKKYTSSAEVEPVSIGSGLTIDGKNNAEASRDNVDRNFVFTQSGVLSSNTVLKRVVEQLNLEELWDVSQSIALIKLSSLLSVEPIYGTNLISIRVSSADASLSVDLINQIIISYKEQRVSSVRENAENQLLALKAQMESQEMIKVEARIALNDIMSKKGIIYSERGSSTDNIIETGSHQQSVTAYFDLQKQLSAKKSELAALESGGLEGEELLGVAAGVNSTGNLVARQYPEYLNLKKAYDASLASGLGRKHPDILAIARQLESSQAQLYQAVESLKGILKNEYEVLAKRLEAMESLKDETRTTAVDRSIDLNDYHTARQDYEEARVMYNDIKQKYIREKSQLAIPQEVIKVHNAPEEALRHSSPKEILNLGIGVVLGLVLGFMAAFLIEKLDQTIKTIDDVERYLKAKVLAVIPKNINIDLNIGEADMNDLEAYRILRTNIDLKRSANKHVFSVCSAGPAEGKSTTIANLANAYANSGYLTVLVDADMRRPSIHKKFKHLSSPGLSDYFTGTPLDNVVRKMDAIENLYVLPAGSKVSDPMHLLGSEMMKELVEDLRSRFDIVLIDSPPILGLGDASLIANLVDETFLVIQYGKLPRKLLKHVSLALEESGGSLMGVVLNQVDAKKDAYYEYYTNYYNYYSLDEKEEKLPSNKVAAKLNDDIV